MSSKKHRKVPSRDSSDRIDRIMQRKKNVSKSYEQDEFSGSGEVGFPIRKKKLKINDFY
jgi:hypothetical protein